jgi:hypothetical protein
MNIQSLNLSQVAASILGALVASTFFLSAAIGPVGQLI